MSRSKDRPGSPSVPTDTPEPPIDPLAETHTPPGGVPAIQRGFFVGSTVALRYKIVANLGRGGMGEVFEAEDLQLHETVALKTLRFNDPAAIERLKRETQLARRVTHPNVCRTYDLGFEQVGAESLPFVTMELLRGETLGAYLTRRGRLPAEEGRAIAEQIAAGLTAAHAAGVLHRDLKPDNVLLVPGSGGPRVVVTDFGLARAIGAEKSQASGVLVGTPAYMAPEQITGGPLTEATDVYAFGIVLFQMATASLPFVADTPLATAFQRVQQPPPRARSVAPEIDPRWDEVIARCLEREPGQRFRSVLEAARALDPSVPLSPGRRRRVPWAAVLVALLVLAVGISIWLGRRSDGGERTGAARRTVAVLGFKNLNGAKEAAWLSTALAELLRAELAAGGSLRAVDASLVGRAQLELGIIDIGSLDAPTLARLHGDLGADAVVYGTYEARGDGSGDTVTVDLRVEDPVRGETLLAMKEETSAANLFTFVSRAGARMRDRLHARPASGGETAVRPQALPADPEAARLYAEGLARLRTYDLGGARALLTQAVERAPEFAAGHEALARVARLGADAALAKTQAEEALRTSVSLPREQRLRVEAGAAEARRDYAESARLYESLFNFFPDDPEYGIGLAQSLRKKGERQRALDILARVRHLPPPAGDDPRLDLEEAVTRRALKEFERARDAAERAEEKGTRMGAGLLVAQARLIGASVRLQLGDLDRAGASAEQARSAFEKAGELGPMAEALDTVALVAGRRGDLAAARAALERNVELFDRMGDRVRLSVARLHLANAILDSGDHPAAIRAFEATVVAAREVRDPELVAIARTNEANALSSVGRTREARAALEEALAIHRSAGNESRVAEALDALASELLEEGSVADAERLANEALALARKTGANAVQGNVLGTLGSAAMERGGNAEARRRWQEALEVRTALGNDGTMAEARSALAQLDLEEGKVAEAEKTFAEVAASHARAGRITGEALALGRRAEALSLLGRKAEAAEVEARALERAGAAPDAKAVVLEIRLEGARILARSDRALAARELGKIVAEAKAANLAREELDAGAHLAQLELAQGKPGARERLRKIAADAEGRGMGDIARRARNAARKP